MVTVFDKEVFDLFAAELAFVLTINAAEGRVRFEVRYTAKALTLLLDRNLFLSDCDEEAGETRAHNRSQLLVVTLFVSSATNSSKYLLAFLLRNVAEAVLARDAGPHACLLLSRTLDMHIVPFNRASQW